MMASLISSGMSKPGCPIFVLGDVWDFFGGRDLRFSLLLLETPSAVRGVKMLQILLDLGNGRDAAAFVSCCWKLWAAVLRCSGQWPLIHAVGSIVLQSRG
ncbi:hypothetical protein Nepgr_003841 [Nepenthes gracilis]|uniref:Uncharacterized protein n=1 Tax=Nepenthes gracilis TaxID=150966 RepID=A0AAD3S0B9_NEPGR|nr:hypothetical protein Nepgr_003841 [Nepenthes gracilis]